MNSCPEKIPVIKFKIVRPGIKNLFLQTTKVHILELCTLRAGGYIFAVWAGVRKVATFRTLGEDSPYRN